MVYDVLTPAVPVIALYILTYGLQKLKIVNRGFHVNLWNFIILLAFTVSGIGGFVLLILIDNGIRSYLNPQLLYWHVEAGIALTVITIFHFHCYPGSISRIMGAGR